ncbi:MAG: hypothetical protein ACHREM_11265, partial [Polyangiales bacterium]
LHAAEAIEVPAGVHDRVPGQKWNRASFIDYVRESDLDGDMGSFEWLLDLAERFGAPCRWGAGATIPTIQLRAGKGHGVLLVGIYASGVVVVGLSEVRRVLGAPVTDRLRKDLNRLPAVSIRRDNFSSPNLPIGAFRTKAARLLFASTVAGVVRALREQVTTSRRAPPER